MKLKHVTADEFTYMVDESIRWSESLNIKERKEENHGKLLKLQQCLIKNVKIVDKVIPDVELAYCLFENVQFINCNLRSSFWMGSTCLKCTFDGCDFTKSNLSHGIYAGAVFTGCIFSKGILTDSIFTHANFTNSVFAGAILSRSDLRFAYLEGVSLHRALLDETIFWTDQKFRASHVEEAIIDDIYISMGRKPDEPRGEEAIWEIFLKSNI